jgi:hypothetical protein
MEQRTRVVVNLPAGVVTTGPVLALCPACGFTVRLVEVAPGDWECPKHRSSVGEPSPNG